MRGSEMRYYAPNNEASRLSHLWEAVLANVYDEYLDALLKRDYTNPLVALAEVMNDDFDSLDVIVSASDQDFSTVVKRFQTLTYYNTRPKTGKAHLRKQAKVAKRYGI